MDIELLEIFKEIMEHITVLNDDYTALSTDVAVLKIQVNEIIWWIRAIFGAFIVMFISQLRQMFLFRKSNGK